MSTICRPLCNTVALVCCGLLAASALAQNKPTEDENIDPSKTKTSHSESGDTQTTETKYFDKQGNPVKTEKTTVNPEGTTKETEVYKPDKVVIKTTEKKDNFGKEVQTSTEVYKDGALVSGTIKGPKLWKIFNPDTGKYEDWKPVKPFSNAPESAAVPWSGLPVEQPAEKPKEKPKEKPVGTGLTNPKISGQVEVPYEYKPKEETDETGKPIGMGPSGKPTLNRLVSRGAVKVDITGTGETIGHIADVKIENVSHESLDFYFPPTIVESKSGKNQDYAAPRGENVALRPGQTKTVPVNGTCLERGKPAEPKGASGDLRLNDGGPAVAEDQLRFSPKQVSEMLHTEAAIYNAVDDLAKRGAFKNFPYHDKEEQKRIAVQWSTWSNPDIAAATGGKPATKEDMKTVAKRQLHRPVSSSTEKEIDKGVDTMWEKIELTSEKAKDLEKSAAVSPFIRSAG